MDDNNLTGSMWDMWDCLQGIYPRDSKGLSSFSTLKSLWNGENWDIPQSDTNLRIAVGKQTQVPDHWNDWYFSSLVSIGFRRGLEVSRLVGLQLGEAFDSHTMGQDLKTPGDVFEKSGWAKPDAHCEISIWRLVVISWY